MAYGRFGGAPRFGTPRLTAGDGRQAGQSSSAPAENQWGCFGDVEVRDGGSECPKVPPSRSLAGCRNGKTRPAKGGEERGMNG